MRYLLADAQLSLKRFDDAISTYTQILLLEKTDVAYANRGLAFWETRRYHEALTDYLKALRRNTSNYIAHRGAAEMYLKQASRNLLFAIFVPPSG